MSGLFESGSGSWSFVPQINIPIFSAGRLEANLDHAEVLKDTPTLPTYRHSVTCRHDAVERVQGLCA